MIPDSAAREQALDIHTSFIVQAPAGSGKTELLTQRFLALLAHVEKNPEQIVAITFTKKAAQEMRMRIMNALIRADKEPMPQTEHAQKTYRLAKAVLARDRQENWEILSNPNRLMIKTIDSLCASITAQMPILSQFGSQPAVTEHPQKYYEEAATEILVSGLKKESAWHDAVVALLTHLDNHLEKAQSLLAVMLSHRDQWLDYVVHSDTQILREKLELTLVRLIEEQLMQAVHELKKIDTEALLYLACFACSYLSDDSEHWGISDLSEVPSTEATDLPLWKSLSRWLLTKEGNLRKAKGLTKKEGFPAPSSSKNPEEKKSWLSAKERMGELLQQIAEQTNLESQLARILMLPEPYYDDESWALIEALITLLPIAAASLHVLFARNGEVDFSQVTQAALRALSEEGHPSDLAFAMDARIAHWLIDEFQDTSFTQWQLIEKLTQGWQTGDGRTLFLVGDPMQSIYRFRQAEVSLFLKAQQSGIGDIVLSPLVLSANFRSCAPIIHTINHYFSRVFPTQNDLTLGAVSYKPSHAPQALHDEENAISTRLTLCNTVCDEADCVVAQVRQYQQLYPHDSIAILVRARSHLTEILTQLNQQKIPFTATEIESLAERPVIQDLLALTCALLHRADKVAWLSVLRAPWCGITLADMLILSEAPTIWDALRDEERLQRCGLDSYCRLTRVRRILDVCFKEQGRQSLREFVWSTWLALGGPKMYTQKSSNENAETFFRLLESLNQDIGVISRDILYEAVGKLYANNTHLSSKLHIMTIHKAKGLEFDHVILPGLHKSSANTETMLLNWVDIATLEGEREWLFSAIPARNTEPNAIFEAIRDMQKQKEFHEMARVFYVGVTRAKKTLSLTATYDLESFPEKTPSRGSFLGLLWPHWDAEKITLWRNENLDNKPMHENSSSLSRIKTTWKFPEALSCAMPYISFDVQEFEWQPLNANNPEVNTTWQPNTPRAVGTLVHEILYELSKETCVIHDVTTFLPRWRVRLQELQVGQPDLDLALNQVSRAIAHCLKDPIGRWILSSDHLQAESEYALSAKFHEEIVNVVIDRTFVDPETQVRWIIDYKTSLPQPGESMSEFINRETQVYASQLMRYAKIMHLLDPRPIRLGLYFVCVPVWHPFESLYAQNTEEAY